MRRTVLSDNACAVNTQNNRHTINRHIVNELVICTLQKRRIQRADRTQALFCHAGGHRDGVFLRNADIKKAIAIQLRKRAQTSTRRHRCCNRANFLIGLCQTHQLFAKFCREIGHGLLERLTGSDIKFGNTVVFVRLLLCVAVSLAFFCFDMDEHRLFHVFGNLKQIANRQHIVTVYRSEIGKAHLFKHGALQNHGLDGAFGARNPVCRPFSDAGAVEHLFDVLLHADVLRLNAQMLQMTAHRTDIFINRHVVVVEHDNQRFFAGSGGIERFVCHTAAQCTVTDDCNNGIVFAQQRARMRHALCDRNRAGRMSCNTCIVYGLRRFQKAGDAAKLPQLTKCIFSSRQNFVCIALVPHIKEQAVARCVKTTVQCYRQLYRTEIGRQMSACLRDMIQQKLPNFSAKFIQLFFCQRSQHRGQIVPIQKTISHRLFLLFHLLTPNSNKMPRNCSCGILFIFSTAGLTAHGR